MPLRKKKRKSAGLFARITIGSDGRLYWHELTPELLEVAAALCSHDPSLQARLAAFDAQKGTHEHHAIAT